MSVQEVLCLLLRSALNVPDDGYCVAVTASLRDFGEEDWDDLIDLAGYQTVRGLLFSGVSHLGGGLRIPDRTLVRLMDDVDKVECRTVKIINSSRWLVSRLSEDDVTAVLMKGASVGKFYPEPSLRESGDIDIYIPEEEMSDAMRCMDKLSHSRTETPDGSIHYKIDGIDVDIHSRYFDLHAPKHLLPPVPSPEATLLMLSSHILKHALGPGVGMRQICDMAMAYRVLDGRYDREKLLSIYSRLGLLKWNADLCVFIRKTLGMEGPVSGGDEKCAEELRSIIFSGGDFGHHSEGRYRMVTAPSVSLRKVDTFLRILRRFPSGMRWSGREYLLRILEVMRGNFKNT